jgi:magnesium transporter
VKTCFELKHGSIVQTSDDLGSILVYVAPDDREKQEIIQALTLDTYDLESALDPEEISRVEFTPDHIFLIWKRPKSASFDEQLRLDVSSLGLFLYQNRLTIIMNEKAIPFAAKEFQGVSSPVEVLLKFLLYTVRHYLAHLKVIKQLTIELESKISTSMENRYLLQMFALSESLIYYLNAIEANGTVLTKLRGSVEKLGLSKQLIESLDDIILDNQQCARQAQIYSTVLSGLMDARGTLINNNMNVLLKNLTLINIIFLPLNLIASILGMSEFSMMMNGIDWRLSYALFSLAMVVIGLATWYIIIWTFDKRRWEIKNRFYKLISRK